ncbi:MAG TPA: hypothetical protein VMV63_01240 [Acidithiobacillus sp.]|nr:hypothetical protein [Acidithiobacillus sp.]
MLYKILSRDGHSINGGDLQWSLPRKDGRKWIPGDWHEVVGELKPCESGLHLAKDPWNRWYRWGARAFVAEHDGECVDHGDKIVCRKARLLRELRYPRWLLEAGRFVASIADIPYHRPDGKPLKRWRLFTAPKLAAAGDAAGAAAWAAAWAAARAAVRDAVRDAVLLAQCLIVADRIDPKHLNHAKDRMRVWQKGYCLLFDVAGVLYVYAAAETREEA